jgi:phosphatidylserine decarboxylase
METPFSGWQEGMRYDLPLFVLALVATALLWRFYTPWASLPFWVAAVFVLCFFRDFPRHHDADPATLISPADGTVVAIEDLEESPHYDGPCRRVSIFMSVFNAHVNRAPFDGEVRDVRYMPGEYLNAMKEEASKVNESNALWLDTAQGLVTVRQISGAVARRIVCRAEPGMKLTRGEKFGMIKFGSRVEVYLPPGTEVLVSLKQKTRSGKTSLAKFS